MSTSFDDALDHATEVVSAAIARIHDRDHTVWQEDPTEVADRLGWLDSPAAFVQRADELESLADDVRDGGMDRVLLLGMGGSSLYPEVLMRVVGTQPGGAMLLIRDTTSPSAVAHTLAGFDPSRTLVIPASKSGGTIETRTLLDTFWAALVDALGPERAGGHVVAITDPGSALAELGAANAYRRVVLNPPDIGGRFAALSAFGMVPAALLGMDVGAHLAPGVAMVEESRNGYDDNGPAQLGAFMAAAMQSGRYALTIHLPEDLSPLGDWIEQLVAESTGKAGVGLLPIVGEPILAPNLYGPTRALVVYGDPGLGDDLAMTGVPVFRLPLIGTEDLAGEVVRWETATAFAGAVIPQNPFDQPNVQAAKSATEAVLKQAGDPVLTVSDPETLLALVAGDDVICVLAYLDPGSDAVARLPRVADRLQVRFDGVPVTVGLGPRYLHSTGQWHKGGPNRGVFLIVVDPDDDVDVPIPDRDLGFRKLFHGQAAGDLAALRGEGRRVGMVTMHDLEAAVANHP